METYQVLCVVDTLEQFQEIKRRFAHFSNLAFTQCRADTDCRFILRAINVDIVIADTESIYDVERFCESIEKHADVSPAIIFQSDYLHNYNCAYRANKDNLTEIVSQLLPCYDFQKSA